MTFLFDFRSHRSDHMVGQNDFWSLKPLSHYRLQYWICRCYRGERVEARRVSKCETFMLHKAHVAGLIAECVTTQRLYSCAARRATEPTQNKTQAAVIPSVRVDRTFSRLCPTRVSGGMCVLVGDKCRPTWTELAPFIAVCLAVDDNRQ